MLLNEARQWHGLTNTKTEHYVFKCKDMVHRRISLCEFGVDLKCPVISMCKSDQTNEGITLD